MIIKMLTRGVITIILLTLIMGGFLIIYPGPKVDFPAINPQSYELTVSESINNRLSDSKNEIDSQCKDILYDHGKKTAKSILIFHGFTSCTKQFQELGKQFYNLGYNVYIPRLAYHGFNDKLNSKFEQLTYRDLASDVKSSLEIALGIGEEVDTIGLSAGGVLSSWIAINNDKVKNVQVIAPMYSPIGYKTWSMYGVSNYIALKPNEYRWWDDTIKDKVTEEPLHAYPRYSSKAANAFLIIANQFYKDLSSRPNIDKENKSKSSPKKFILVTLQNDKAVSNPVANDMLTLVDQKTNIQTSKYEFTSDLDLDHDIIDPFQPKAKTDIVYPKLIELLK
jgi:esterase/lipase